MKKAVIWLTVFLFLCGLAGCHRAPLTLEEATDLVQKSLPEREYDYQIRFEGNQTVGGRDYYTFCVYTVSEQDLSDGDQPLRMQYTHSWPYVDAETGELYELGVDGSTLLPLGAGTYAGLLSDYRRGVEERLSPDFEERHNSGEGTLSRNPPNTPPYGDWAYMIIEMDSGLKTPTVSDFGYTYVDLNEDGVTELLWLRRDGILLAVFTLSDGQPVLLNAFWPRYKATLTDEGALFIRGSGGADYVEYYRQTLPPDGTQLTNEDLFGTDGAPYEAIAGERRPISRERLEERLEEFPAVDDGILPYLQEKGAAFIPLE